MGTVVNLANTHRIMMTNERSAKHDRLDGGWRLVREQEADKAVRESNGNIWKAVEVLVSDQDHDATIHVPELTVDTEPVHHNPNNESSQDSACSLQDDDVIKPMETTNTLSPLDLDSKAIAIDTLSEKVAISEQGIKLPS